MFVKRRKYIYDEAFSCHNQDVLEKESVWGFREAIHFCFINCTNIIKNRIDKFVKNRELVLITTFYWTQHITFYKYDFDVSDYSKKGKLSVSFVSNASNTISCPESRIFYPIVYVYLI